MPSVTTRREFLLALSSLGIISCGPVRAPVAEMLPQRPIPGRTETLPVIGLGSTKPVRLISMAGTGPLESVMRVLLEHGGRVIDSAPRPVELDREFGAVLQQPEFRDRLFVAVKVNAMGREAGVAQFRQTQRLFGRRTVDLVQIESMTDYEIQWPSLRAWKDSGEARYIGVTVAHEDLYPALEVFMRSESPDFVQLNYSVMETLGEQTILPLAQDRGIAVLVNGPFMNGEYFGFTRGRELPDWSREFDCESWAHFSLKYILAHPAVTCVLTETTSPEHMLDNIRAAFGRLPDAAAKRRMREFAERLRG